MNLPQIDRFFEILADELAVSATAILTGAAAAQILGGVRPSMDIDFALRLGSGKKGWDAVDAAVQRAIQRTGVQADYAEDIGRWGMISLLDYEKHASSYKKFGALRVLVMDPAYWSIGKVTRYLEPDTRDLLAVLKKQKTPANRLVDVWGRAVKASPRSADLRLFLDHARHFFRTCGRELWGKDFDIQKAERELMKKATSQSTRS